MIPSRPQSRAPEATPSYGIPNLKINSPAKSPVNSVVMN